MQADGRDAGDRAQRYINKMAPNDAPTTYLKNAYQRLIDAVETKAGTGAVENALKDAMNAKVKYNAERISRTEIARSYNEAFNARIADNPEVTGYKWLLSSRHVIEDECTMLAELDNGQGAGVYRKDDFPTIPVHPNCMCMKVEHYGKAPPLTQFKTVVAYLKEQPLERRAAFIGKANAQHLALFRRGLAQRGLGIEGQGTIRRVPQDLIAPKPIENKIAEGLTSGGAGGILDSMGADFGLIEGEHSIQQDLAAVNPKFRDGRDEYTLNCGNCTAAYELRRRGLDVEAKPRILMRTDEWADLFEGFQQQKPTSRTKVKAIVEIEQNALSWGEGARGTVFGKWDDNDKVGHFFSVEVSGGKVLFVDSQSNRADVKRYLNMMKPSSLIFGRLDNLGPNSSILNAVKARGTVL